MRFSNTLCSRRAREVVLLASRGLSNNATAQQMGVSRPSDCDASRLSTRWTGGHSREAKTKAFTAGTIARLGTEDSGYDLEDEVARCDAVERADPGTASGCVSHLGARGMAALRSATPPGREVQVVQRSTVRRKGAGRRGPISEPAPDRPFVPCVDEKSQIQAVRLE
jgi:hypothetical protein